MRSRLDVSIKNWQIQILHKHLRKEVDEAELDRILVTAALVKIPVKPIEILAYVACGLLILILIALSPPEYSFLMAGAVVALLPIKYFFQQKRWREQLSEAMREYGYRPKTCLLCKYDLTGTVSEACPECGEKLAPESLPEAKA